MNRKLTFLLVFCAIFMIAFIVWIEPLIINSRNPGTTGGYLLDFRPPEVSEIAMVHGTQTIALQREGRRWKLTQPLRDEASSKAVEQILEAAKDLRAVNFISAGEIRKTELHLKDFGLHSPKQWIDFKGDKNFHVIFGKDAAGPNQVYVSLNRDEDVYITSNALRELALENVDFFRMQELSPWSAREVAAFSLRLPTGELELHREGDQWMIIKPLRALADPDQTEKLLNALLSVPIDDFIPDGSTNLAAYGISEGVHELHVFRRYTKEPEIFRFGTVTQDGKEQLYAQSISRNLVASIHGPIKELLAAATPDNLRDRHLLQLNLDTVDRITIHKDGRSLLFVRDEEDWIAKEGNRQTAVPHERISQLVQKLEATKVASFFDAGDKELELSGLHQPEASLEISAWLSENTPEENAGEKKLIRLEFARSSEGRTFARKDEAPEILALDEDVISLLSADPTAWENPQSPSSSPSIPERQD